MRHQHSLAFAIILALTSACGGGGGGVGESPDSGSMIDGGAPPAQTLEGLWRVDAEVAGDFGTTGAMTLQFPAESSGQARFLGKQAASGVTTCGDYVFALIDERVLVLESARLPRAAFTLERLDANTVKLASDTTRLTLTRITGSPPVEECGKVKAETIATLSDVVPSGFSRLSAVGNTLYFNGNTSGDPIVSYSLATRTLGPPRTYTVSSLGGIDRLAVAAGSNDVFFGHCGCGGSTAVSRFDVAMNQKLVQVETTTLGATISVRYGAFLGSDVIIGGSGGGARNKLLTLNATTLALQSERTILNEVPLQDIAHLNGKLYALTSAGAVVSVAGDGSASKTYEVPELRALSLFGLEGVDGKLYVLASTQARDKTFLLQLTVD